MEETSQQALDPRVTRLGQNEPRSGRKPEDDKGGKPLYKKWWFWLIIIAVAVFAFAAYQGAKNEKKLAGEKNNSQSSENKKSFEWPDPNAKTISAMPLDLSQVKSIGKFRSCAGHDRSGYNFSRQLETDRSMKHYFDPTDEFRGTRDKIGFYAPFDGTVVMVQLVLVKSDNTPRAIKLSRLLEDGKVETIPEQPVEDAGGRKFPGDDIQLMSDLDQNAVFGFNHVNFSKDWKVGDKFKAGELIGYSSLGDKNSDFDMDYVGRNFKFEDGKSTEVLDSMFYHMTPEVLAEFAKYGITPENIIFTKEERDAKPCGYDPVTKYNSPVCQESSRSQDPRDNNCFVKLKKNY